jgi:hypothetical protein
MIALCRRRDRRPRRTLLLAVATRIALGLGGLASSAAASAVLPGGGCVGEGEAAPAAPARS